MMPLDAKTRAAHRAWRQLADTAEVYADESFNQRDNDSEPDGSPHSPAQLQRCAMRLMRAALRFAEASAQLASVQLFEKGKVRR